MKRLAPLRIALRRFDVLRLGSAMVVGRLLSLVGCVNEKGEKVEESGRRARKKEGRKTKGRMKNEE